MWTRNRGLIALLPMPSAAGSSLVAAALTRLIAIREQAARENPPGGPFFVCVCGETGDPFDSAWMAIHQPHCAVAGLDKLTK